MLVNSNNPTPPRRAAPSPLNIHYKGGFAAFSNVPVCCLNLNKMELIIVNSEPSRVSRRL